MQFVMHPNIYICILSAWNIVSLQTERANSPIAGLSAK